VSGLVNWVGELAGADGSLANPLGVTTQYYDTVGGGSSSVSYAVSNGGTLVDSDPYPASGCTVSGMSVCLTDAQLQAELSSYLAANPGLSTGLGAQYFIFTPQNVDTCFDSSASTCAYSYYCGYHSEANLSGGRQALYADMPWLYQTGCDSSGFGAGYPNSDELDSTVSVFSHELSETMTDPQVGSGWVDSSGNEIGDKCAYVYGPGGYPTSASWSTGLSSNGTGYWNVRLGSDVYLLQSEFDNQSGNCVLQQAATWTGTTAAGSGASNWSQGSSWNGTTSPVGLVDTLTFPTLSCPGADTCYVSQNDLQNISAYRLSIDDGSGYAIDGNPVRSAPAGWPRQPRRPRPHRRRSACRSHSRRRRPGRSTTARSRSRAG
jgi:hypothetical protein